jgi:hypothetical protein
MLAVHLRYIILYLLVKFKNRPGVVRGVAASCVLEEEPLIGCTRT